MRHERTTDRRIDELLGRLERLEATTPRPEERAIRAVARDAIMDELSRLARDGSLNVYRHGDTLDAVHLG